VRRADARVLLVGVGGLGCPAAMALAATGIGTLGLCDDDVVETSNLHRQILFGDSDVGDDKVECAERWLARRSPRLRVQAHRTRILPQNALELVGRYDLVLEGSDNFATKFLVSDACSVAGVPVVHASAIRWVGTALAVGRGGRPCYRCLFEDLPEGSPPNCAEAGVMGPVAGLVAAAQVDLGLAMLDGVAAAGQLVTVDGRAGSLRRRALPARRDCATCAEDGGVAGINPGAYAMPACAG
jgi:adenylyltransferase/sulfurtransferase